MTHALAEMFLGFDPQVVVRGAIERGEVRVLPQPQRAVVDLKKYNREFMRNSRAKLKAQGISTVSGEKLRVVKHPELDGLVGKDYQREYMRLLRSGVLKVVRRGRPRLWSAEEKRQRNRLACKKWRHEKEKKSQKASVSTGAEFLRVPGLASAKSVGGGAGGAAVFAPDGRGAG